MSPILLANRPLGDLFNPILTFSVGLKSGTGHGAGPSLRKILAKIRLGLRPESMGPRGSAKCPAFLGVPKCLPSPSAGGSGFHGRLDIQHFHLIIVSSFYLLDSGLGQQGECSLTGFVIVAVTRIGDLSSVVTSIDCLGGRFPGMSMIEIPTKKVIMQDNP